MNPKNDAAQVEALLQDGIENLDSLSDARLREYAVYSLKDEGAQPGNTFAELAAMATVSAARTRERHADALSGLDGAGLPQMFVEIADNLERELKVRALPN